MKDMQIIAPRIVDNMGNIVESKTDIQIIISGDTYDKKDFLKAEGFVFDGFRKEWVKLETREYFKVNSFTEIRKIAKELQAKPQISGEQAAEAVATMIK